MGKKKQKDQSSICMNASWCEQWPTSHITVTDTSISAALFIYTAVNSCDRNYLMFTMLVSHPVSVQLFIFISYSHVSK